MQVSIKRPDLEQFVADKVKRGEYTTADDVVEKALETLKTQQEASGWTNEDLRREIQLGVAELDRGEGAPWDVEEIISEAQRELTGRTAPDAPRQ